MKKILTLLILISLSSCLVTEKQKKKYLKEHCVTASVSEVKDTTTIKETVKTTSVYVSVPGPKIFLPSPCEKLCDSLGNLKPFKQESSKNGIRQSLHTIGNVLVQECDVDSLLTVLTEKEKTITRLRSEKTVQTIRDNCQLQHFSEWDIFWGKVGKIALALIALYVVLRFLKVYLKTKVPWLARFIP